MWPPGEFKRLPRGTTAGHVVRTHVSLRVHFVSKMQQAMLPCPGHAHGQECYSNQFDGSVVLQGLLQLSGRDRSGMLNVNNRLVPETTTLSDGDLVIMSDELLSI